MSPLFLSAAHADYKTIKYVLMKVGEKKTGEDRADGGKVTLDCALEKLLGADLKKKIIMEAYNKDFTKFFFENPEHLDLYFKKPEIKCCEFDLVVDIAYIRSFNLARLKITNPEMHLELVDDFAQAYSGKYFEKVRNLFGFRYEAAINKKNFFYGVRSLLLTFLRKEKKLVDCKNFTVGTNVCACAWYGDRGMLVIDETHFHVKPYKKADFILVPQPEGFPTVASLIETEHPQIFVGTVNDGSALCFIKVTPSQDGDGLGYEIDWHCVGLAGQMEVVGLGCNGCGISLYRPGETRRGKQYAGCLPYTAADAVLIAHGNYSFANATMLYRVIQDKIDGLSNASDAEHETVQKMITDMYAKTLQRASSSC